MTDFTAAATSIAHAGKHNMASDAFDALRAKQGSKGTELGFADLIDTLNPLQHIPVVSQIYRHLTGDTISSAAQVAGDALYGGAIGLVTSVASAAVGAVSGSNLGDEVYTALFGDDETSPVKTASTTPAAPAAPLPADTTGSIVATANTSTKPAGAGKTQPVPQLSPEAFNALINSFADPKAAEVANPALTAESAKAGTPAKTATATAAAKATAATFAATSTAKPADVLPSNQAVALASSGGAQPSKDLMSAMQKALDQYDAMKATMPALPAASLDMSGGNDGF